MSTKKTDPATAVLIQALRKQSWANEAPIWRDIAKRLEKPARSWSEVNVGSLERSLAEGDVAAVPGKLLGAGALSKNVSVAAVRFSEQARAKITGAGGRCLTFEELVSENPKGSHVKILG